MSRWFRTYGFAEILDNLLIGAYPLDADDVGMLEMMKIERVLNLVEDEEYGELDRQPVEEALDEAGIEEYRLQLTDFGHLPPEGLETAVAEVMGWLDDGIRTYVHCRAGWQRSAAVAAGVVAVRDGIDIDEAVHFVQVRKPSADPLPHQRDDMRKWWQGRSSAVREGKTAAEDQTSGESHAASSGSD